MTWLTLLLVVGAIIPIVANYFKDQISKDQRKKDVESINTLQVQLDSADAERIAEVNILQKKYDSLNKERIDEVNKLNLEYDVMNERRKNEIKDLQLDLSNANQAMTIAIATGALSEPYVMFSSYSPDDQKGIIKFGNDKGRMPVQDMRGRITVSVNIVNGSTTSPTKNIDCGPISMPANKGAREMVYFDMPPEGGVFLDIKFSCTKGHFTQGIVIEKSSKGPYVMAYQLIDDSWPPKFKFFVHPDFPLEKSEAARSWAKHAKPEEKK